MTPASIHYRQCLGVYQTYPTQRSNNNCKTEQRVSGDTVTWKTQCKQKGILSIFEGKAVYKHDTMIGTVTITKDGTVTINDMSGKRIGVCSRY